MIGELLRRVTAALEMAETPYMLTGSIVSSMYGTPRSTNDIDIVIAPAREQLLSLIALFQRLGLTVATEAALAAFRNRSQFNVLDLANGLKIDLIIRKDREFSVTEFNRRETHEVEDVRLTIATPEDIVIAKLEWAKLGESDRQLADVAGVLKMQRDALDISYIEQWVEKLGLRAEWLAAREKV